MLPCSMRQIVETGRLRQQALLAEADRDRRVVRAVVPTAAGSPNVGRSLGLWSRSSWGSLAATLGAIVHHRLSHP